MRSKKKDGRYLSKLTREHWWTHKSGGGESRNQKKKTFGRSNIGESKKDNHDEKERPTTTNELSRTCVSKRGEEGNRGTSIGD